jgi:hypothetical protein
MVLQMGFSMGILWEFYGNFNVFQWDFMGFLWEFNGI